MLSVFFFFFFWLGSMWHPSSQTRDRTCIPLVEGEVSLRGRPRKSPVLLRFHTFVKKIHVYVFLTWEWESQDQP